MRVSLLGLLAATALSTAAFAQASPFGPPSAPLTAEELSAIKEEGAAIRRQREAAARRAAEKREAAAAARESEAAREAEAAAAAASAPIESTVPPDGTAAAAAAAAPTPAGAGSDTTTVIPNAVVDPASPTGMSAAPTPTPAPMPEPMPVMPAAPADPIQIPAADVPPGGFDGPAPAPMDDSGIPPLPTGE